MTTFDVTCDCWCWCSFHVWLRNMRPELVGPLSGTTAVRCSHRHGNATASCLWHCHQVRLYRLTDRRRSDIWRHSELIRTSSLLHLFNLLPVSVSQLTFPLTHSHGYIIQKLLPQNQHMRCIIIIIIMPNIGFSSCSCNRINGSNMY